MPKYGHFEHLPVSWKALTAEQNKLNFDPLAVERQCIGVTKLVILYSPKFLVCSLFTAHTCTVTAYTHHFDFGTGREYIMSCSGSHEARRYTYTARRSDDKGDDWVSRSLEGYSQDAGSENCREPGRRGLVRRPCGKPEGLVMERVAKDTCETWDCTHRSVAGHVTSRG